MCVMVIFYGDAKEKNGKTMGQMAKITRDSDSVWGVALRHLMGHPTSTDWLIVLWGVCWVLLFYGPLTNTEILRRCLVPTAAK